MATSKRGMAINHSTDKIGPIEEKISRERGVKWLAINRSQADSAILFVMHLHLNISFHYWHYSLGVYSLL